MIDGSIRTIQKPSRYLGEEVNVPRKNWAGSQVRMALAFPDVYEMGMSHLGILLLYDILNRQEWIGAERVFCTLALTWKRDCAPGAGR